MSQLRTWQRAKNPWNPRNPWLNNESPPCGGELVQADCGDAIGTVNGSRLLAETVRPGFAQ